MSNPTAIIVLDEKNGKRGRKKSTRRFKSSVPKNCLDVELGRFLKRLSKSKEFDERQLFLPGFFPEESAP